ncbi:MAG: Cdc6/Cdc18 family protein [Thermoplasmata archaeon]|jgi:cell division control protein 6|nr:AAA family ATPase [Thermoplasmatales archaeon]
MDNIFKKYLEGTFPKNIDYGVFEPSFIPHKMPHREKEIGVIAENLGRILLGGRPKNILVFGKSGTGKTATMKYIGRELEEASRERVNVKTVFINCQVKDNSYSIFETLGNAFNGERIPFTGWSFDRLYATTRKNLDQWGGNVILVLDEIDRFVKKNGDDFLYQILLLDSELEKSRITIVGITNDLKFSEYLDSRVKSRLNEEKIVFPPYSSDQIYDILMDRVNIAGIGGFVSEGALRLISSLASQENGDARKAIEMLRTSIQIAFSSGDNRVEEAHVFSAKTRMEYDAVMETIRTLPVQAKALLLGIILLRESGNVQYTTGEVFEAYRNVANGANLPVLTPRRISDMLSDLDSLGLITAHVTSLGRYGRTKMIEINVSFNDAKKVIFEDENFSRLKNTPTMKQLRLT